MSKTRQLAAIKYTDMVGYTSLMGHNDDAFQILEQNRKVHASLVGLHNGKLEGSPEFKENINIVFISNGGRDLENPRRGAWGDPKENTEALEAAGMNTHFYVSP